MAMAQTIRLFEHGVLKVGQTYATVEGGRARYTNTHHKALTRFHDRGGHRYYALGHRKVRFKHYVGVVRIGALTLEVLPKTDRQSSRDVDGARWHDALLGMLRITRRLTLHTPTSADLRVQKQTLFDLYIAHFLTLVEDLIRRGLVRRYRTVVGNRTTFKGRLLCPGHIRANLARPDRFYVAHQEYDHEHLINRVLATALDAIASLALPHGLRAYHRRVRLSFPDVCPIADIDGRHFDRIVLTRRSAHYRAAIDLARLIVLNYAPDVSTGAEHLLAVMFDMNVLFEQFVGTMARRLQLPGVNVRRQVVRSFSRSDERVRIIKPDLLVDRPPAPPLVIDTKWKVPSSGQPSSPDLKQMYVYNQYFDALRCVLLYPRPTGQTRRAESAHGEFVDAGHAWSTVYLDIFDDGTFAPRRVQEQLRDLLRSS